ncbi:MAG: D-alanyl-D-alanine carboxypeptidase/D-alanyl-D-alanine-endopeptidase [Prolixibacteraceae bacterium]|jgi:D-alanyl-D-alanine carboxypeptidase/D-alanyl-D-alanine-endopeptidase (penicillin-binding protein 4)|nr:D-alanyl-D-alanine carboxypeptidase/D-alanyl-D-alanine-endopeptidase [Prolixibacteraceae bacterium]
MRPLSLFFLLFCTLLQSLTAQKNSVGHFFNAKNLSTASYCIYAIDARTGDLLIESDQKSLSSASVMKLFTTAVALEILGPDFTFSTSLYYSGNFDPQDGTLTGNLILRGGGDPAFYSSFFEDHYKDCMSKWVAYLKKSGIRKIKGNLLLDLSALGQASIPGGWAWDDIGNYYGAGVSAITYQDNLYNIHFSSSKTFGVKPAIKSIDPEIPGLILDNNVTSSAEAGDHTIVYGAPGSMHQTIEGTIPADQTDFVIKAAMPDPPQIAGHALIKKLKEEGIDFYGVAFKLAEDDKSPRTLVGTQLSPPLKDLIVPLNKESLNLYAEHLLCEIGRKYSGEPSRAKGLEAYHKFCLDKGIDSRGFFPADGSGLTRSNAMTSKMIVETMKFLYDGPNRMIFLNALPIAGVDGTLRNSFKGTPLEKNVTAKTGSMAHVRSIAGLMRSKSNKTILFAILINNFDLKSKEVSKLLESMLLSFYND